MINRIFIVIALLLWPLNSFAQFDIGAISATKTSAHSPAPALPSIIGFTPTSFSVSDSSGGGTVITTLSVQLSNGGQFSGTCGYGQNFSNTDPTGLTTIASTAGGCILYVISAGYTSANQGTYQLTINACESGVCINSGSTNFTLYINAAGGCPVITDNTVLPTPPTGYCWSKTFDDEFPGTSLSSNWYNYHTDGTCGATVNNGTVSLNSTTTCYTYMNTFSYQYYGYFVEDIQQPVSPGPNFGGFETDIELFNSCFANSDCVYQSGGETAWGTAGAPAGDITSGIIYTSDPNCCQQNWDVSFPSPATDLSAAAHQYGFWWINNGGNGQIAAYLDGVQQGGTYTYNNNVLGGFEGVHPDMYVAGTNGSSMLIHWVREYQLVQSNTPSAPAAALSGCSSPGGPTNGSCFNTLAMNMDFTGATTSSVYNNTSFNGQTLSQWLDCAGAPTPALWLQASGKPTGGPSSPCNDVSIVTDSLGNTALQLSLSTSDFATPNWVSELSTYQFAQNPHNLPGGTAGSFPEGYYAEAKISMGSSSNSSCTGLNGSAGCFGGSWWMWGGGDIYQEQDFVEYYLPSSRDQIIGGSNVNLNTSALPNGYNFFSGASVGYNTFHILGFRQTVDGNGNMDQCIYVDNVQKTCGGAFNTNAGATGTDVREIMVLWSGPGCVYPAVTGNNCPATGTVPSYSYPGTNNMQWEWIRVWSCANWQSGNGNSCPGVLLDTGQ